MSTPVRDLRGYGDAPPHFEWPTGARLAVNIVVNFEEGAERNVLDGDSQNESLAESHYEVMPGDRELATESWFEYGSRVGIWRLLRLFDEYGVAPTVFATALALERSPDATRALIDRGCQFVGHGYRWVPHTGLSKTEEAESIARAQQSLTRLTGKAPLGWFNRPPNTVNTRRLLARAGFVYDSGAVNDDIPYFVTLEDRPFLVVPYSLDSNDTRFAKNQFFTSRDFGDYLIDTFDVLYADSDATPRMMSVGLHPRIVGRPGRMPALRRFLEHTSSRPGVWFGGRDDIARFWLQHFAPDGTWNWP